MTSAGAASGAGERSRQRVRLARALFPALAADLDAALARHGVDDGAGFDAWLDRSAAELLGDAGFDEIADAAVAARFERAFAAARTAATGLGAAVPEPEAFAAAGVDFAGSERAMSADADLVPVPAPFGLGAAVWQRAFEAAGHGLVIASEALREFAELDSAGVLESGGGDPSPLVAQPDGLVWSLRLVPAGQKPPALGLGYAHGPHVALPEMLMLQLMRAAGGADPVDAASFTWLAGPLAVGRLAARHVYDASERTVRITCREVGSQGPHLGSRTPIV